MKILPIINKAPYRIEKTYNALKDTKCIQKESLETDVAIFLMVDVRMREA